MTTENEKPEKKDSYASKFAAFGFLFSVLLFMGGFFYGTRSMDAEALFYCIKQVLLPAALIGGIGFLIGRMFDNALKIRRGLKKSNRSRVKY